MCITAVRLHTHHQTTVGLGTILGRFLTTRNVSGISRDSNLVAREQMGAAVGILKSGRSPSRRRDSHHRIDVPPGGRFLSAQSCLYSGEELSDGEAFLPSTVAMKKANSAAALRVISVAPLADRMRSRVRNYTQELVANGQPKVRMVGILADHGDCSHQDAEVYSRRIAQTFSKDGIAYEECRCSGDNRDDVEETVRYMNERDDVHGILVFYPIFKKMISGAKKTYMSHTGVYYKTDDDYIRDTVEPSKDVEGLRFRSHARNMFRARSKQSRNPNDVFVPCTALAVTRILDNYALVPPSPTTLVELLSQQWMGYTVTIINRSEILGRPLAGLLALRGATVYSVDDQSILVFFAGGRMRKCNMTMEACLAKSSVIVTGVPSAHFSLPTNLIQEGATVVNVSGSPNVDEAALLRRGVTVNYVPQVGKVTVAALEENLIRLHQQRMNPEYKCRSF